MGKRDLFGITGRRDRRIGCNRCRDLFIVVSPCATHSHNDEFNRPRYAAQCDAKCLRMNAQRVAAARVSNQTCNEKEHSRFRCLRSDRLQNRSILTDQRSEAGDEDSFADHVPAEGSRQLLERTIFRHSQCEIAERHATEEATNEQPQHQMIVLGLFGHYCKYENRS